MIRPACVFLNYLKYVAKSCFFTFAPIVWRSEDVGNIARLAMIAGRPNSRDPEFSTVEMLLTTMSNDWGSSEISLLSYAAYLFRCVHRLKLSLSGEPSGATKRNNSRIRMMGSLSHYAPPRPMRIIPRNSIRGGACCVAAF